MYQEILDFWFRELEPTQWWQKDEQLDALIRRRFGHWHEQAMAGEWCAWRESAAGSLAEVIILDQFSRNIYRGKPESFLSDPMALALAQCAIAKEFDRALPPTERGFLYMPFMHSESRLIHEQAVKLFESLGNAHSLEFEYKHKRIIDRFGRYPHRNPILGRESSAEELEFLTQPDSSF
ncbi:MAG: hypothetical protein BWY17_05172 [Deltaproteobacteria bacterium ADurb.Bin207]|jgi:uncharacterized protein (DUF924 family)|nr:MAG: hypothetical protein BWY17_05172 [Deltaproteobacteria bacterium ADurb.Bin207]HOH03184.1 DUF924 family protein [Polyangiaceae bacterium]HPB99631.1 DUF924 family protein [Polyangiaceae bacterium]HPK95531.1 DUF924 family protein [Polyangiaceae bacterium]